MKELTTQQEAFAQAVASGKNQADAYRTAYPKSQKWKPEAVWVNASKLMADATVSLRVSHLKNALAKRAMWSWDRSVTILAEIAEEAEKNADRVRAITELNKMHGFLEPEKVEHSGSIAWPVPMPKDKRAGS